MLVNIILLFLLNLMPSGTVNPSSISSKISYSIRENSSLTLAGSSNVNKFECTTYDNFSNGFIFIQPEEDGNYVKFTNAVLSIDIKSFDCKNPILNKDFYNTLNARETPTIEVELLNAVSITRGKILQSNNGKFKADVAISLNGTSKADQLIISWEKVGHNLYRFIGEKKLLMSDFDIETPVAALGFIKVHDDILISFDLYIQAGPKTF